MIKDHNRNSHKDIIRVENEYYILATSAVADDRTRVLKHGDTFGVFDRYGDILPVGMGEQGLYHEGTRFLNRMELRLWGSRPLLLSSLVREDNSLLSVDFANPDISSNGSLLLQRDTVHIVRFKFLWNGTCYERLWVRNYARQPVEVFLNLEFSADYRDIFEVRGIERKERGTLLEPTISEGVVCLGYRGLDGIIRRTRIESTPAPAQVSASHVEFVAQLRPKGETNFYVNTHCIIGDTRRRKVASTYPLARTRYDRELEESQGWHVSINSSNEQFNHWVNRSFSDLRMMVSQTQHGLYPYAGIPWYSTAFGRDGIITAMQVLWMNPLVARGVLSFLAAHQARVGEAKRDADPGKILHEVRRGEMALLEEVPFGLYYGSVDSTPLFIMLAGWYYERTGDLEFIRSLWPHIIRGLKWIDTYGDVDHDGFVEYQQRTASGLVQQGWKDSHDSVFHADGQDAEAPIALCEVQGYVYAAKMWAGKLAHLLGHRDFAGELIHQANALQIQFEKAFWCSDCSTYALALDGRKRACSVVTSNAGHALFSSIASRRHAFLTAKVLLDEPTFSGWGVRTVASTEVRYNPMSYHNGSVWPHDNAMIAFGLSRYGFTAHAMQIFNGLFDASTYVDLHRLPELFCGFQRRTGEGLTIYPLACAPQAWASGAVFMCLQSVLGLHIDAPNQRITFIRPALPEAIRELEIRNVTVGKASLDFHIVRHRQDVSINVTRRRGAVNVTVENW